MAANGRRFAKIILPHIGLYCMLCLYLALGAFLFPALEDSADREAQRRKLTRLRANYHRIWSAVRELAGREAGESRAAAMQKRLYTSLEALSSAHEGFGFLISDDAALPPRWTPTAAVLYPLSILTTTGLAAVAPLTRTGQTAAIIYGLIGIPLVVLAAVDLGRFLAQLVLKAYTDWKHFYAGLWKRGRTAAQVQPTQVQDDVQMELLGEAEGDGNAAEEDLETEQKPVEEEEPDEEKRLPLILNAAVLVLFCALGGILYIAAGGNKSFVEAFFVTFNLVANLTMSEMPNDLNHILTVLYIAVFVTFGTEMPVSICTILGVAVLSMCAELATFELKELFLKIHYFGRKITFKRKPRAGEEQIDVEVKELLKIIEAIRRRYPGKERITTQDILEYIQDMEMEHPPWMRALFMNNALERTPGGTRREKRGAGRRDTIAFMPQWIEALRFADEMDVEEQAAQQQQQFRRPDEEWPSTSSRLASSGSIVLPPPMPSFFLANADVFEEADSAIERHSSTTTTTEHTPSS